MKAKVLYTVIDGEITGGNIICLKIIEETLRRNYGVVVNSPAEGKFTDILKEKGIKVYNVDTRRSFRLDNAIRLTQIIKREGIGLVHSHLPLGGAILSRLAGRVAGVPVITHAHLQDFLNLNPLVGRYQFLLNWVTSRLLCAKVITVSESVKRDIIKQGVDPDKINVVYNGIDLSSNILDKTPYDIRKEFSIREDQPIISEVGRLCKDKGQHILIKSASKVIKEFPQSVFIIVGEDLLQAGKYKEELEGLARNLGIEKHIIFTGYRSDIMSLMRAFDILVLPSLVEGLSVAILEAMAARRAVISTSIGGNPEIVIDGETGTIIPPKDPDRLAEAIIYHLNNPEASRIMGEKGYERVREHFTLSQMLDSVMDIYKEVLAER